MLREYPLITYEDLAFADRRPDQRRIGRVHPVAVLVVEKETVSEIAFEVAQRFGVTVIVPGDTHDLVVVETFVRAQRKAWRGHVRAIAYVDYDLDGYVVVQAFTDQLRFYGLDGSDIGFRVTPNLFTPRKLNFLSAALSADRKERRTPIASCSPRRAAPNIPPAAATATIPGTSREPSKPLPLQFGDTLPHSRPDRLRQPRRCASPHDAKATREGRLPVRSDATRHHFGSSPPT